MKQHKILLISANRHKTPYPIYPLGTAYLKPFIEKNIADTEVIILDCNLLNNQELGNSIREINPNIIGVSFRNVDGANSLDKRGFMPGYKEIIAIVKENSCAPIIIGGSGFSIFPLEFMSELDADYGVHGEGEKPLTSLISCLLHNNIGEINNIPSVISKGCKSLDISKDYVKSITAKFQPDLLEYYWKHSGMLNIQTKRGCPNKCIYCSYPYIDGRCVRTMDTDEIALNLKEIREESGADYFFFTDSIFNICNLYNQELAKSLIKHNTQISWGGYFSPSNITEEQMALYKASGLKHIEFGTESLCDQTLAKYGKNFTVEDIFRTSNLALKHNVYYAHFLILGGYGETAEELAITLENSKKIRHTVFFPYIGMRIYPNTPLYNFALEDGTITQNSNLMEPHYYIRDGFDLEETRKVALATNKAWVFPDDPQNEMMTTLRIKKNKKGLLWEYLRKP